MNKTFVLVATLVAVAVSFMAFLATNNFIISLVFLLLFEAYLLFAFNSMVTKYIKRNVKEHECFSFVNSFLISMNVTNSLKSSFDSSTMYCSGEFKEELKHIEDQDIIDRLLYLQHYFTYQTYQIFLKILSNFIENGGDLLKMSELLVAELTRNENQRIEYERKAKAKMVEFVILWVLTFIILVFVRVALKDFYDVISSSSLYLISVSALFLFSLFSIHYFISAYTGEKLSFGGKKK